MIAWQRSRQVVLGSLSLCEAAWRPSHGAVFSQLQRAALSVQLNIAEGYALWHPKQRRRHLRIAYGSAVETVDLLELLQDCTVLAGNDIGPLVLQAREVCRMLIVWLKRTEEGRQKEST